MDDIEEVKQGLNIETPDDEMGDDEVAEVCRYIGFRYGGIPTMVSVALVRWPDFYERYKLYHTN